MPFAQMNIQEQWFDLNGNPLSGGVLKAYEPGDVSTSISIFITLTGGSPQASITLNAEGKYEVSGNEILPYIDREHMWALFSNASDAAANTNPFAGFYDNVPLGGFTTEVAFNTVALMESTTSLSVGQFARTRGYTAIGDGGDNTYQIVAAGTSTDDGGSFIDLNTLQAKAIFPKGRIAVEQFGAVAGADFSTQLRAAIVFAAGRPVYILANRYIYDEAVISTNLVNLVGERMPNLDDLSLPTTLENGTIIQGKLELSGRNIQLRNLGVDRGSASFGAGEDAVALVAPFAGPDLGESAVLENIVGLGFSSTSVFHSVQVEGYRHVFMSNCIGANNFFTLVYKGQYAVLSNLIAINCGKDGLIIKADSTDGAALDVAVSNLVVDMDPAAPDTNALRIRSQDAGIAAKRIAVSGLVGRFATNGINIDASDPGLSIDDVVISDYILESCTNGLQCKGKINNLQLNNGTVVEASGFIGNFDTNNVDSPVKITINGLYGSVTGASLFIDDALHFGAAVGETLIDDITMVVDRDKDTFAAIRYLNPKGNNDIGTYRCNLRGAGIPIPGFTTPTVTGTAQTITQSHDRRNNRSFVGINFAVGATVSLMDSTIFTSGFGSTEYPEGYSVVFHNNSVNTGVINHNPVSGGFYNKGDLDVTLLANEAVTYTYSGFLWLES